MKTYSIEVRVLGITQQHTAVKAPSALIAIDNVIAGLCVRSCNEYIAREVKNETLSMGD